jgi:hypothetical protein
MEHISKPISRVWRMLSGLVVLAFVSCAVWWLFYIPSVGKGGLLLAVGATLMPLFWEKVGVIGKMFWIAMLFALLAIEYRAIDKDRMDGAAAENQRRTAENAEFQKIADGLTTSIRQSQEQFVATMDKSNRAIGLQMTAVDELSINLDTLTGADSFCYLGFTTGQQYLPFVHIGKFPLYEVSARIVDLDQSGRIKQGNLMGVTVSVGDMIRGHASIQPLPNGLGSSPDYFNANVFFNARNGDWMELLREQRVNGKLVRAMRVVGRFTSLKKEKPLCETIDPEFPREPNGDIDSDFHSSGPKLPRCQ